MGADKVLVVCLSILRWSGLTFSKAEISPSGYLVGTHSKFHLVLNLFIVASLSFLFSRLKHHEEDVHDPLLVIYPLYMKMILLNVILFLFCGNVYIRKFIAIINGYKRASNAVTGSLSQPGTARRTNAVKLLMQSLGFFIGTFLVELYVDANRNLQFEVEFKIVEYISFIYIMLFTTQFAVTMSYIRETFEGVNGALGRIVQRDVPTVASVCVPVRRRVTEWMKAYMLLREVEPLVNEVFGKQIFLTFVLAFSSVIVNVHYFLSANMFGFSYFLLNLTMIVNFFQAFASVLISAKAAELAANEANRVNEVIFDVTADWGKFKLHNQIKYFTLFNYHYPTSFRVWVFYELNYDSLFKVMMTSCAITAVLIQFDLLKRAPV